MHRTHKHGSVAGRLNNALLAFLSASILGSAGCGAPSEGAKRPAEQSESTTLAPVQGNPFANASLFLPPYSNADQARRALLKTDPASAALIAKIADTPQARWLGEWSGDSEIATANYVQAAHKRDKLPLLVAYNMTHRDCGLYSKGGASGAEEYRAWIAGVARGIGPARRAVVVLEPDALGHLTDCLNPEDQEERLALLRYGVTTLEALPGVSVYIDAGHSRWLPAEEAARRLKLAGVDEARGFALNVSNYIASEELIAYGERIVAAHGGPLHFIIDTSRNGNGAPEASGEAAWCNPTGRALGARPSADTGNPMVDAFVWIKSPGESDGSCQGGPPAGRWFSERALELARNAKW